MSELSEKVRSEFESRFGQRPLLVRSPGRINLIGEHIDYNGGLVFPAAIDKEIVVGISRSDSDSSTIVALDLDDFLILDHYSLDPLQKGHWGNYVIGILQQLQKRGIIVPNFNLVFAGNIPLGAGLSSSAALENGLVFGLNELFNFGLTKLEMVKISQLAEHEAVGVQCGIMDQFTSMFGVQNQALILDCDSLKYEAVPVDLGDNELLLINTNVKHQLSDSPYNERRAQCAQGLSVLQRSFPELKALAHANLTQLESVKNQLSETEFNRCQFVIEEQHRVLSAKSALESSDLSLLGQLLFASHSGLKNLYEVSCPELDFLVDQAKNNSHVLGVRMMGGGFGGCTINLVRTNHLNEFASNAISQFEAEFGHRPSPITIKLSSGTSSILKH